MTIAGPVRVARFDALFAAYRADIAAYCRWRSSDPDDALAEVFLTAWRRLDDVPADNDAARVWLYATARRVIANQRRAARRRLGLLERLHANGEETPHVAPDDADRAVEAVHEALRALKPLDREVLLLAEWEELSSAEIAQVMGCSAISARGRLHRARKRFRAAYERLRPPAPAPAVAGEPLPPSSLLGHRPLRLAEDPVLDRLS